MKTTNHTSRAERGFTLIETLVAITLLMLAVIAPMTLTVQSLSSSYYARDDITAYYLAQDALESVRSIRDGQILQIAESSSGGSINLFGSIPIAQNFVISSANNAMAVCSSTCPPLQSQKATGLYGYSCASGWSNPPGSIGGCSIASGWSATKFTRVVQATWVDPTTQQELNVSVTVSWQTNSLQTRSFTLSDVLYRWVNSSSAT